MKREIKFRGKRVSNGEWEYGFFVEDSELIDEENWENPDAWKNTYYILIDADEWHEVRPETVGQYTGFKDKHGREIYEGDILRFKSGEQGGRLRDSIGVVRYRWGAFVIDSSNCFGASTLFLYHLNERGEIWWISPTPHADDLYCIAKDFEVIGNIHDNPELLKQ